MKFIYKICMLTCLLFLFINTNLVFSQTPTFTLIITNDVQVSSTELQFDIYLRNTGGPAFQLSGHQYGIFFNSAIRGAGTLSASLLAGSSTLTNSAQVNASPYTMSVSNNQIRMLAVAAPGPGNGSIISSTAPGTKIARVRLINTVAFPANTKANLAWCFSNTPIGQATQTQVSAYIGVTNTALTTNTSNTTINSSNPFLNTTLNITGLSPTTISAGTGSVLTINGTGFGATRGTGNLIFDNANDPNGIGPYPLIELELIDWANATWSDVQIQVIVPSHVVVATTPTIIHGIPGSGFITVRNNAGNTGSTGPSGSSLDIDYGITGLGNFKKTARLARYNCNNPYVFYLGNNITVGSQEHILIAAACNAWKNYLNIDIVLNTQQQPPPYNVLNDISVIYIDNSLSSPTLMFTQRNPEYCSNNTEWIIKASDIAIKSTGVSWWYQTGNDLPTNYYDFYAAILHEIGHALGQQHSIDLVNGDKNLMHASGQLGSVPSQYRQSLTSAGGLAANGELNSVVIPSLVLNFTGCTNFNTLTTPAISSPQISPSSGATCANLPFTLTSSAVNGGAISNLWSNGATTNAITVTTPGTYTLTVTQNTCSSTAPTVTLTSLTASTVSTHPSNQSTCTGGTANFASTGPGGSTYKWQRSVGGGAWTDMVNGSFYSNVATSTLTVLSAQTFNGSSQEYRCMITQSNKCPQPSNVATLTVQTVTLAPLASVYANASAFTLTAGSPSGGVYSGTGISGGTFTPSTAGVGNHTITYTKSGCSPSLATQVIQVVTCCANAITTNITTDWICIEGASFALSIPFTALGTYNAGNTFTAQLSNASGSFSSPLSIGTLSGTTSGTISASIPTSVVSGSAYRIRVISSNVATTGNNNLYPIEITHTPCDGDAPFGRQVEINPDNVKVYPNPASNNLVIELPAAHSFYELELFDINGRVFVNKELNDNLIEKINLSSIVAGAYTLKLKSYQTAVYKKILVIK